MAGGPRPDGVTLACAGLVAVPALFCGVAGAGFLLGADERVGGPAGLGAVCGLVGSLPLLVGEYCSVVRGSRWATSLIAGLALYGAVMGSIAWIAGLVGLIRGESAGPDAMSTGEFVAYTAVLAWLVAVGLGHLRWLRLLREGVDEACGHLRRNLGEKA